MQPEPNYDLRSIHVGNWESAKIRTKTNGRWIYIFDPKTNNLLNVPEPIKFEQKYKPTNHLDEFYKSSKNNSITKSHTLHSRSSNEPIVSRAPLVYSSFSGSSSLIAPVVYGQFVSKSKKLKRKGTQTAPISRVFPEKTYQKTKSQISKAKSPPSVSPFVTKSELIRPQRSVFNNE